MQQTHHRTNNAIRCPSVRVIHGDQNKILPTQDAIALAKSHGLDLIEISPSAQPPVCRIADYGKFLYEQEKSRKADKTPKVKEVQFHVNIAEHDFQTKIRHAQEFLGAHHPVVVRLQFRGRENAHKDIGMELFQRVEKALSEVGTCDGGPRLNGKLAILHISPGKHKKPAHSSNGHSPNGYSPNGHTEPQMG